MVLVEERIFGAWEILSNTHPFQKARTELIRFEVLM